MFSFLGRDTRILGRCVMADGARGFRVRNVLLLALALNLIPSGARAQAGNQGSIEGFATDSSGGVIPGVAVTLRNLDTSVTVHASTNNVGLVRFPILPVGAYELTAEHPGFATLTIARVVVNEGARVSVPLTMSISESKESVTVSPREPIVETTRSDVSATLDGRMIANVPVNGRDFANLALLTPGVTRDVRGGLSFSGQRGSNVMRVDGVEDNDPIFDQPIAGGFVRDGRGAYQFSQSAIEELRVSANAYGAELGHATGGVVSVVTKSGTNEYRGTAFEFYRDKALNANDPINILNGLPKSPFHVNQAGGVVGGPLRKNTLFFFINYEALRSTVQNTVILAPPQAFQFSSNPDAAHFEQLALAYLQARAQSWTLPLTQDVYLPKVDWQVTRGHLLSWRWNRQRFTGGNLGVGPLTSLEHATVNDARSDTVTATLTSSLSSSTVNVARFNYLWYDQLWHVQSPNAEALVFQGGQELLAVGQATSRDRTATRAEWSDTVAHLRGRHTLKIGGNLSVNRITDYTAANFSGSYRFNSLESFGRSLAGAPQPASGDQYTQAFSGDGTRGATVRPTFSELSAFTSDDWRVRSNITLTLGARYDLQLMTKPPVKNPSPQLAAAGLDTSELETDTRDFAPRLGVAWTPRSDNRMVVRGGYGLFYGRTPGLSLSNAFLQNGITVQTRLFRAGSPSAALIPSYPSNVCGPPDAAGLPPDCSAPAVGAAPPSLFLFGHGYRQPVTQQASTGAEFQLHRDLSVGVTYLFVKGSHLQRIRDVNLGATTPGMIGVANSTDTLVVPVFPAQRPLSDFDAVQTLQSDASSVYHGMIVQLNKRFSSHVQLLASYTLGKVIDDAPSVYGDGPLSDPTNPSADRGPGVNDQRHRLSVSGVWDLDYADRMSGVTKALMSAWQLSFILTAQSGQPYSGMVQTDLNNDGNPSNDRTPGSTRNSFYAPSTLSVDPRLARTLPIGRRSSLQLALEAFNVFNRTNIIAVHTTQYAYAKDQATCGIAAAPCLAPQSQALTGFGTPMTSAGPRIMQLSARFIF